MKISPKYAGILMSFVMSLAMLAVNVGFAGNFMPMWMKAWGIGFVVGFPAAATIVPFARKAVSKITGIPV